MIKCPYVQTQTMIYLAILLLLFYCKSRGILWVAKFIFIVDWCARSHSKVINVLQFCHLVWHTPSMQEWLGGTFFLSSLTSLVTSPEWSFMSPQFSLVWCLKNAICSSAIHLVGNWCLLFHPTSSSASLESKLVPQFSIVFSIVL